jgi:hypothetical protein
MRAAVAIGIVYQVGTHVLPPAVVRVGTRIEIAFLGPYTGPPPDSYFVAVVVEGYHRVHMGRSSTYLRSPPAFSPGERDPRGDP